MLKISTKWVPKYLKVVQRQHRVECTRPFLKLCLADQNPKLDTIVTGDEIMGRKYEPPLPPLPKI